MGFRDSDNIIEPVDDGGSFDTDSNANSVTSTSESAANALLAASHAEAALAAKIAAELAETNAETAETNAETAETNAETAETNASTSATNAATSETNASTSETNAAASASAAASSAAEAQSSEDDAEVSETNAANSAAAALVSENNASSSESNAATSAVTAATQAGISTTKAGEASVSAAAALVSENNAGTSETNAADSETNAATSATDAAASETNSVTSATNAATSETNAANSATSAATSETNASNSESAASTSETNAATSETNAGNSATAAATSATNAATSETNAANSATAAATSETNSANSATASDTAKTAAQAAQTAAETAETNAETAETNAGNSATAAATSATNSANSATAAASSASAASTSETNAATSATNAATSETNAATSETNASNSATSANNSATAAQTAQAATELVFDNFDDKFLGTKSSDPSVDNDGNALVEGAMYYNSSSNAIKFYNGSSWEAPSVAASNSATAAATSATNASNSAGAASTSASNAANSATSAATSETNAASSASAASTSETNAATSATNSANSATAAQTAETNAETAQAAAETAETNAETAQAAAETAETNAETSETNAAASASTASTQAGIATTKAGEASTSATNAATSATNAATSETNAATSETNAATSETNAATSATASEASKVASVNAQAASETAETNAETAQAAAETAQTAAETAETNAATSETNAASSASSASTDAGTATTKAGEAATSATNAAASASTATTKASEASTSASNAATSETNAATSATNAATSETNSSNSATASASSASAASTSETNAATSETNASNSATAAASSASAASTSETNAATSASGAATSATNASTSATAAQTAQTAAEAALDSFDDRYLGEKSSDPTVDNDGDALITGALYFSTGGGSLKVYDGTQWNPTAATTESIQDVVGSLITGTTGVSATYDDSGNSLTIAGTAATTSAAGTMSAADKTKLDGVEASATADQTAAEIRTLVESATDSNVFTDADHTKLGGIEAGATGDQTNAEIRAAVEAATDSNVFTDADHTKLNGIEASADVTDTANVVAALTAGTGVSISAAGEVAVTVNHDNLAGFVANEHIDWTTDQGATNIHSGNYVNTVYTHPTHPGDDAAIDTGALTGATVISDLDLNITTDTQGHVTDANATVATRTMTLADLGYTGATNANNSTPNATHTGEVTGSGALTIADNVVDAGNLKVTGNGTTSQFLRSDGDGTFTWATPTDTNYSSGDFNHDSLSGYVANEHIDWTASSAGTIHLTNLPATALTSVQTAVSQVAMLALTTQEGDVVVRSDENQTYMHNGGTAGTMADFTLLATPTDSVTSVDGATGVVTLNHDTLSGFVANEHIDWTTDQGATNIHSGNYINTTYSVGDGGLTQKNFTTTLKTKLDGIAASATNTAAPAISTDGATPSLASGITAAEIRSLIGAGTSSSNNATHTGEVTGSGALTIASNVVDADNLKVTGNGTATQFLRSDGDGTFTWATPPDTNTVYTHPTHPGDDMSVDTGPLTGATVISDLDFNVTTDTLGHVTDANATVSTRNLTLANLGYTGATNANYITNNNQLTNGAGYTTNVGDITGVTAGAGITGGGTSGTVTINHADTSSQASVNNSNGTVIQDITLDTYGHITGIASTNLDGRYVNVTGDTMTGTLTLSSGGYADQLTVNRSDGDYYSVIKYANSTGELARMGFTNTGVLHYRVGASGTLLNIFHDNYHPNADKWTTARTLSLSGDASGSVSWDGSGNATLSVAVANDSHNHTHSDGSFDINGLLTGGIGAATTGGTTDWNHITNARSGQGHTLLLGSHTNGPSGSGYYHPFSFEYNAKDGSGNMTQFAIPYNSSNGPYFRYRYSNSWTGWNEIWHSGNDGSGSGLDADLLDGNHASAFAPASHTHDDRYYTESEADSRFVNVTGDTITGTLTTANLTIGSGNRIKFANNDYIRYDDANGVGRFHFDSDGGTNNASVQAATFVGALSGNASTASKWTTARTLSLSGDASGSVSWDGSANATLSVAVADDSHNHSSASGNFTVGGDLIATDVLPPTDNTGVVGNSSYTWSNGRFTSLTVDSTLSVRGAVDLSDNDYLRLGASDDFRMWHDGTNTYFRNYLHAAGSFYWQGEGTGGVNHNLISMHNDVATPYVRLYYDSAVVLETVSGGVNIAGNTAWHAGNDGASSGLDADLLDGQHGSYYYPASNPNGYTTYTANQPLNTNSNATFNALYVAGEIIHSGDTNTYISFHAEDHWRVVTGGAERLEVNNAQITSTEPIHAPSFHGDGSSLTGIAAGATGGGNDDIFYENGQNVTSNYTITNGKNAMSAGPITINSGVTVTVGAGETWTVV